MARGQGIAKLYQTGGVNLLAYRLGKVFVFLETPEQVAIHNEVVCEVMDIINKGYTQSAMLTPEENSFLKDMAEVLLYQRENKAEKRKRFLFRVASQILNLAQRKG